jgi:TatD DNase family protein
MWIDAHTHLDLYADDLELALEEIRQNHILCISNSLDLASYQSNLEIAQRCEWAFPIFGVHPWKAAENVGRLEELRPAIAQSPMLGEIGLDCFFVKDASQYPAQRTVFVFFLQAAQEQDKIVHLHTKGAEREVLELLDRYGIRRAIVHWYSGPLDLLSPYVKRGAYFTVGPEAIHSEHIQAIARAVPAEQLLAETDNPGGPKSYLGREGMPSLIQESVRGLAMVRGTTPEEIRESMRTNLIRLIRGDERLSDLLGKLEAAWVLE